MMVFVRYRVPAITSNAHATMIVFSDLDGTLLDHHSYDWGPAKPALAQLENRGIPLILVSSKTLAELRVIREQLALQHPVVAENGALTDAPLGYFPACDRFATLPITRAQLQSVYQDEKTSGAFLCEAFFELGVTGIVRETGLSEKQAALANDRVASEPILWLDSTEQLAAFENRMSAHGLRCVRGGRFLHLMGDTGKDDAVRRLLQAYSRNWPDKTYTSVSLGDAPNDLGMLSATDIAVVLPRKRDQAMTIDTNNRVLRPTLPGPAGWNETMMLLLAELDNEELLSCGNGA